jgi:hypothetical protein
MAEFILTETAKIVYEFLQQTTEIGTPILNFSIFPMFTNSKLTSGTLEGTDKVDISCRTPEGLSIRGTLTTSINPSEMSLSGNLHYGNNVEPPFEYHFEGFIAIYSLKNNIASE